jgi:hypothetical protein
MNFVQYEATLIVLHALYYEDSQYAICKTENVQVARKSQKGHDYMRHLLS